MCILKDNNKELKTEIKKKEMLFASPLIKINKYKLQDEKSSNQLADSL